MNIRLITQKIDGVQKELHKKFAYLCTRRNFEELINQLKEAKTDRDSILALLYKLLRANGISFEEGMDNKYYEELVANSEFISFPDIEREILSFLYSQHENYPAPGDYMQRIVDRLEPYSGTDSLRLRILRRFIEYGDYLSEAGFRGEGAIKKYTQKKAGRKPAPSEIPALLDDGIFSLLEKATKDQKKPDGTYGIIKLADDLAGGKFRTGGNTRRGLYLFAMVYNMTYAPNQSSPSFDADRDLEKNLFRDYYCNNLMRFISESYSNNLSEFDMNPSGQGINYKNFAEMIYIYYIASDYSPEEKIARASRMINEIVKDKEKHLKKKKKKNNTLYFRRLYTEDVLEMDEQDFYKFIIENYDFNDLGAKNGISNIAVSSAQDTAYRIYEEIMQKLTKELEYADMSIDNCNYGLWFTDVAQFKKTGLDSILKANPDADREKVEDFLELMLAVNDYLGNTENRKTKALHIDSPKEITRTAILVAYYYYYNMHNENSDERKSKRFEEVFGEFSAGVNRYLEAAYFQKLDGRSIFDVMVVFSAYAYINY